MKTGPNTRMLHIHSVVMEARPFANKQLSAVLMSSSVVTRVMAQLRSARGGRVVVGDYEKALLPFLHLVEWQMLRGAHAAFLGGALTGAALVPLYRKLINAALLRHLVMKKAFLVLSPTFPLARCIFDPAERAALRIRDRSRTALLGALLLRAKTVAAPRLIADVPESQRAAVLRAVCAADAASAPSAMQAERAAFFYFGRLCALCEGLPDEAAAEQMRAALEAAAPWTADMLALPVAAGAPLTAETRLDALSAMGTRLALYWAIAAALQRHELQMPASPAIAAAMQWLVPLSPPVARAAGPSLAPPE